MKKILLALAIMASTFAAQADVLVGSTNAAGIVLLSTNRASVYQIDFAVGNNGTNTYLDLFDCDTLTYVTNGPAFGVSNVTPSYVSRQTYTTNVVTSFVGYNGYTNWYTNAGIYTINVTNAAATNAAKPVLSFVGVPNTMNSYNVNALFVRGIVARFNTNATVVISYNSGQ